MRESLQDRIADLCRASPGGVHRLVIIAKVRGATNEMLDEMVAEGRLEKIGGAPSLYVVKGQAHEHEYSLC